MNVDVNTIQVEVYDAVEGGAAYTASLYELRRPTKADLVPCNWACAQCDARH